MALARDFLAGAAAVVLLLPRSSGCCAPAPSLRLRPLLLSHRCRPAHCSRCEWIRLKNLKVLVVFEGRDTAGKGGVISRIASGAPRRGANLGLARVGGSWWSERG